MPEWYVEGDTQARVRERKGAQLRALCVVSRWWESGQSVFHFERLKVQTSIYSVSQIILSSRTQERWNVNRLFFPQTESLFTSYGTYRLGASI